METMLVSYLRKYKKLSVLILCLPFIVGFMAIQVNDIYTVSGSCEVQDEGVLFIYIVDSECFKRPMTGLKTVSTKVVLGKSHTKKVDFSFAGIPKGTYGIRCFLDKDGNKKLNRGMFGPTEPWGMSFKQGRTAGIPTFLEISFKVDKSVENLIIHVK